MNACTTFLDNHRAQTVSGMLPELRILSVQLKFHKISNNAQRLIFISEYEIAVSRLRSKIENDHTTSMEGDWWTETKECTSMH
jgi:hypothetical protein